MKKRIRENMKKQEQARQEAEKVAQAAQAATSTQLNVENSKFEESEDALQVKNEGKVRRQKGFSVFGVLFGGLFFVTSSAGLFLLYKFRKTFAK